MRCFVADHDLIGECPTWDDRTRRFRWIDVAAKRLQSCDEHGGDIRRQTLDDFPGSFGLRESEGLVVAFRRGVALLDAAGAVVAENPLAPDVVAQERFNDGACDSRGRFWVGTMDKAMQCPVGGLYRIDPDLSIHRMTDGIGLSNGIAFSPDDTRLYHCDSSPSTVWVHDFDAESGTVSNRRELLHWDYDTMGKADGCAVDAEGFLWIAAPGTGSIMRFDPDGALERILAVPTQFPASLCFGGDDLQTIYITSLRPGGQGRETDGRVYVDRAPVPGLPTPRFAA